jgi:flagellar biosynthesis protein FlhF
MKMKYVKIRAKTYNEAMKKLKIEHGDEAIPISHKYVKEGGLFKTGFFSKQVVEVTAGIHERMKKTAVGSGRKKVDFLVGGRDEKSGAFTGSNPGKDDKTAADPAPVAKKNAGNSASEGVSRREMNIDSISRTIDALNNNLNGLSSQPGNDPVKDLQPAAIRGEVPEIMGKSVNQSSADLMSSGERDLLNLTLNDNSNLTESGIKTIITENHQGGYDVESNLEKFDHILKDNDFDTQERKKILGRVKNSISRDDLKDRFKIEKSLKELIKSRIVTTGPMDTGSKKKIIMFIGPTGVGKTTTMAKLGALYSLREGKKVVFMTIDNYRIAATEQLKKYAEIMRIPIHAVNNQKDFTERIAEESADIILVDTSGRSHRNDVKISEIKAYADAIEYDFEKILCVSANIKKRDLDDVFRAFDVMDFDSVVITKVDETSFIGNIVDIADKYKKPIAYYTNGQEVPNDIVVADSEKIVDMILGNI